MERCVCVCVCVCALQVNNVVCVCVCVQFVNELKKSLKVFKEGRRLMFRVTIIQATGIPREYADVFVQYRSVLFNISCTCISLNGLVLQV